MLTKRVIPCLDVCNGRVVKGVGFQSLREAGEPVERARRYAENGADELCFLDVTASMERRPLLLELVEQISRVIFIPFTVGGGVRRVEDARALLRAGADKIALNTAALSDPTLLTRLSLEFGRQCVVLSIDALQVNDRWLVTTHGGREVRSTDCVTWACDGVERGAGEVLLNVVNSDGSRRGFAVEITRAVADAVPVPVIASGGAGLPEHFVELFRRTEASAALAASLFHDDSWTPRDLKRFLRQAGVEVRT